jgi:hypothetical protein
MQTQSQIRACSTTISLLTLYLIGPNLHLLLVPPSTTVQLAGTPLVAQPLTFISPKSPSSSKLNPQPSSRLNHLRLPSTIVQLAGTPLVAQPPTFISPKSSSSSNNCSNSFSPISLPSPLLFRYRN